MGVASIGPQSCIATAIASSFLQVRPPYPIWSAATLTCLSVQVESVATKVTYQGSLQKLALSSLTIQHYFVSAAGTCVDSEQALYVRYGMCMYVYMYIYMCVCVCVCMYVCSYLYL